MIPCDLEVGPENPCHLTYHGQGAFDENPVLIKTIVFSSPSDYTFK